MRSCKKKDKVGSVRWHKSRTHPGIDWSKSDRKGQVRPVEHRRY